jgi:hypothetical protein
MNVKKIAKSWGNYAWYFLHYTSLNYNEELKENYIRFINYFKDNIPCIICKNNFNNKLKLYPIKNYFKNNDSFFEWTVLLHNEVNKKTFRKIYNIEEAKKLYINNYNKNKILYFLNEFYVSNIYNKNILKLFLEIIEIYPNKKVREKLKNFKNNCKIKPNKLNQWFYVYLSIIKNN